jgi:hypothetical protein
MYATETKVKMFITLSNIKNEKENLGLVYYSWCSLGETKPRINNVSNVIKAIMQMVEDVTKT